MISEAQIDIVDEVPAEISNINKARNIMANDPNVVIIIGTESPVELNTLEDKFNQLTIDFKNISNGYCLNLFGGTVEQLIAKRRSEIEQDISNIDLSDDDDIKDAIDDIKESATNGDFITYSMNKAVYLSGHISLYENCLMETAFEENKFNDRFFTLDDVPKIVPFYTFSEYCQLYPDNNIGFSDYLNIENPQKYYESIESLSKELSRNKNNVAMENALIKLGWFPYVPVNGESMLDARKRHLHWLNENNKCRLIDISNFDIENINEVSGINGNKKDLKPVFIVVSANVGIGPTMIKKLSNADYSHSAIGLNSELNEIYTYRAKDKYSTGGFHMDSIKEYADRGVAEIMVLALFVPSKSYKKMQEDVKFFKANKDNTRYDFANLFNALIQSSKDNDINGKSIKMICSQFVDYLLKDAGVDITNKASNIVTPGNFVDRTSEENINMYVVYKGKAEKYNKKKVDAQIKELINLLDYPELVAITSENIPNKIKDNRVMENFFITCPDNKEVDNIFREMREYIKPTIVPELTLDRTVICQEYYNEIDDICNKLSLCAHNNIDMMKYLVSKLKDVKDKMTPYYDNESYNKAESYYQMYLNIIIQQDSNFINELLGNKFKYSGEFIE